ncbi:kynureninase [Flavobacteriaceae bacterium 14752]|uniref:kynureninase n=1 Tax=Mesohalobacter salilacus TaxID=2491711 RepID=UPI000F6352C3|nr:kynureninase [Flavobacteriaceae bacterium 14752]
MTYQNSLEFAQNCDTNDSLKKFRNEFHFPKTNQGDNKIYLCGNSLGLQPKSTLDYIQQELEDWSKFGVDGHTDAKNPWMPYHEFLSEPMAEIVGAKESEVIIMNTLSVNLHLMMVSFYQPTSKRHKIVIEADAFPSDLYAVESQLKFHNFDPKESLILWKPREDQQYDLEDFDQIIQDHADEIVLVLIGNTNYYTGQNFDMQHITNVCHQHEITIGFDLAHGVGNIQPNLHNLGVDFAVWCTYKYLNSGPGSLGGCFVHEKHHTTDLKRFTGWWGHDKSTRFNMRQDFKPIPTAEAWQLSNPPILSMAAIRASLDIYQQAGFDNVIKKSKDLTGFLEYLLVELNDKNLNIITPKNPDERGCQLSIQFLDADKSLFDKLTKAGVVADWREPQVIRVAPAPLYNSFEDVYQFVQILKDIRYAG